MKVGLTHRTRPICLPLGPQILSSAGSFHVSVADAFLPADLWCMHAGLGHLRLQIPYGLVGPDGLWLQVLIYRGVLLPSLNSRTALDGSSWFAYLLLSIYVRESRDGFVDGLDCTSESVLLAVEAKVALVLWSWL